MKKLCIGILAFLSFSPLFAQQTEKSIVVRSSSGVEAAADLPEGMLSETDSLYLDWISKIISIWEKTVLRLLPIRK